MNDDVKCIFYVNSEQTCQKPATMRLPYDGGTLCLCDFHAGCVATVIVDDEGEHESGVR